MTQRNIRLMVAVHGTQEGATRRTFDEDRFLREVHNPVKAFIEETKGAYPVLLFFFVGDKRGCEELITVPLPEQNEAVGCPSYIAAEKHFSQEVRHGLIWLRGFTGWEIEKCERTIGRLMEECGVGDHRILSPKQLTELASELTRQVA
jgi:hypothetical protein